MGVDPGWEKVMEEKGLIPPATASPKRRPDDVTTTAPKRLRIEADVPIRLKSEANAGGKLRDKIARKTAVKTAVDDALPDAWTFFPLPCVVGLTRFGSKELDDDNLRRALKPVRDGVAKWLGIDDADKRVTWVYSQQPAFVPYCRIRIEHREQSK